MTMPILTLVIPAYNEEALLPVLLESVQVSTAVWGHDSTSVEVIVANNCSTDRTSDIALGYGAKVVDVSIRGIGAARNGGAAAARGQFLCFVDADSRIHAQTFREIAAALERPDVGGCATGVIPERSPAALHLLSAITLPARIMRLDSGVVC